MISEKRVLQGALALAACVPVGGGLAGLIQGVAAGPVSLDSHYRYLSGLLLGIGLTFWSLVPRIETNGVLVRALTLIVFTGGLARLCALALRGDPGAMRLALVMELVVTPTLCLWQARIARLARQDLAS